MKNKRLDDFEINDNNAFAIKALKWFSKNLGDGSVIYLCCKDEKYRKDLLSAFEIEGLVHKRLVKCIDSTRILDNREELDKLLVNVDTLVIDNIEKNGIIEETLMKIIKTCLKSKKQVIISSSVEAEDLNLDPLLNDKLSNGYRLIIFE